MSAAVTFLRWFFRCVSVVALAAPMSGCAIFAPAPVYGPTEEQRRALLEFSSWLLDGRIAVNVRGESWTAGLDWRHLPQSESLRLTGLLGQGAVDVYLAEGFMRITRADGVSEVSSRPDVLLQARLGFPVPLSALRYWVVGLPHPDGRSEMEYDAEGRLTLIRQEGWEIAYERFMTVSGLVLPQKLKIQKGDVKLKLMVDQWREKVSDG